MNANVCFLATVSEDGGGAVRAISLRDVDHRGFGLLLNGLSVKWAELESGAGIRASYLLAYGFSAIPGQGSDGADGRRGDSPVLEIQDHGSNLLEMYYPTFEPQTTVVPSRDHWLRESRVCRSRYPDKDDIPLPASLKGVLVVPKQIETWHSGEGRLHDRHRYTKTEDGWKDEVLVP